MGLTKAQLEALNISSFPDNTSELITPEILRTYNSASIANTVNQDAYTTDSASFDSRINSIVTGTGFVTTSSFNAYTSSNDSKVNSLINATASYANSASVAVVNNAQQQQINSLIAATGSYSTSSVSLTSLNAYTASNDTKWNNLAAQSGSWITESETGSFATSAITASSLITASILGQTITFTKGDSSTFGVVLPSGSVPTDITQLNAFTASQLTINTGYNTYTSSTNSRLTNIEATTASLLTETQNLELFSASALSSISQLNASSASQQVSINALNVFTASQSTASIDSAITNLNQFTSSANGRLTNLELTSASLLVETQNLELFSASALVSISNLNANTSSQQSQINSLINATASYANSASVALVDANQQSQINALIAVTASFLTSSADITALNQFTASQLTINSGYNSFTQSANGRLTNIESTTASLLVETQNLELFTASANTQLSNLASSQSIDNAKWNTLGSQSGSWVSASITGSSVVDIFNTVADYQFTYTKGDGTQQTVTLNAPAQTDITSLNAFTASQLTINSGYNTFTQSQQTYNTNNDNKWSDLGSKSGSWITESETGSFARYDVSNPWSANQTFTNISAVSASFQYVQTLYETASVIYSSGSNQFGDELTDTQVLSGSVLIVGNGSINGSRIITSADTASMSVTNAETASIARNLVIIARNGNASTLPAGTVVRITSAVGDNPIFNTASFTDEAQSSNTLGILRNSSPSGADVEVVVNGVVLGVNTDPVLGYAAGDVLYLSSSGQFTKVQPQAPLQTVTLGEVLRAQQNNGSIYVNVSNGWELNELHNVQINNPQTNNLLAYESASYGLWKNKTYSELGLATTGSNSFTGSQTITGSILATDNIRSNNYLVGINGVQTNLITVPGGAGDITIDNLFSNGEILLNSDKVSVYNNLIITGSLTASLQEGYVLVGNSSGKTTAVSTGSFVKEEETGSLLTTASFNSYTASNDQKVNSLIAKTGSYATTGSNTFTGNQIVNGDLTATGYVSASYIQGPNGVFTTLDATTINAGNGIISSSAQLNTLGYATTGSNTFVGNQIISGTFLQSGSNSLPGGPGGAFVGTHIKNRVLISGPSTGETPRLYISGSDGAYSEYGRGFQTLDTSKVPGLGAFIYTAGATNTRTYNTVASLTPDYSVDVEMTMFASTGSVGLADWDNGTTFNYVPFMEVAPNNGDNPAPQFKRSVGVTGSVDITGGLTASLQQGYMLVGDVNNRTKIFSTSSFATTGSNSFVGDQTITGSLTISSSAAFDVLISGAIKLVGDNNTSIGSITPNSLNFNTSNGTQDAFNQIYAGTGSYAGLYVGVYDNPNFNVDVEHAIIVRSTGIEFSDWDNGSAFDFVPYMKIAPNTGNNPTPQMLRGLSVTGSLSVSGSTTITGSTNISGSLRATGDIQFSKGSNKTCDIVSVAGGGTTVSNSLVTSNSIILVTTQNSEVGGDEYPAVVSNKTTGQFSISHNYGGNLQVAYLIINPA